MATTEEEMVTVTEIQTHPDNQRNPDEGVELLEKRKKNPDLLTHHLPIEEMETVTEMIATMNVGEDHHLITHSTHHLHQDHHHQDYLPTQQEEECLHLKSQNHRRLME